MSSNKANPISLFYKNQVHEGTDETEGETTRNNPDAGISSPPIVTAQAVVDSTEDLISATGQTTAPGRKRLVWASGCVLFTVVVAAIFGTLLTRSEPVEDPQPPEEADMRALFLMAQCPGILDLESGACCPRACGQCGGPGCGVADGGAERCCTVNILESSSFCEAGGEAPCIVNVEDPDPSCEVGISDLFDGIGCCPSQCLLCGGSGCNQRPGGWTNCCTGGISSLQTTCDITGAPCVVQESSRRRNLAYLKNATQSSQYQYSIDSPPGNAVDGNVESISHTALNDPNPWWEVDLGDEFFVREVRLFNRRDCCLNRLSNATVQLLDSSGGVLTSLYNFTMFRNDGDSLIVNTIGNTADVTDILWSFAEDFATDPPARRLRVSLPSRVAPDPDHYLSLAHVVVYGIPT